MYCINCGVRLADTEKTCPLCRTAVYHPDLQQPAVRPLYPADRLPKSGSGSKAFHGAVLFLFLIPLLVCLFADLSLDGKMEWFGYAAGALGLSYVCFALPLWFQKPNPVIFVPCDFAAAALYLLYIELASGGSWFLGFALPVTAGIGLIVCAVVTLMRCLPGGRLYILGGAFMALGGFMVLMEYWMVCTFSLQFLGWSVYPLVVLALLGGLLIYTAANSALREMLERKLFF